MDSSSLYQPGLSLLSDDDWDDEVFENDLDDDVEDVFEDEWSDDEEDEEDEEWEDSDDHWSL